MPEYQDKCAANVKIQAVYLDYEGKCDNDGFEYECMSGYECGESQSYKGLFSCRAGNGSSHCPASYTFMYRCFGLDEGLKAACEECTFNDYAAWDYKNRSCTAGVSNRVQQIVTEMNDLLTKSHWRDKNGNFNKARLASDSVAGVVLGTAGGLITSQVIKKNQIKGGFENIQCVISGQVVANYGDEFSVGIK